MSTRPIKWTQELRKIVYSRLTMEFGPYNTWDRARYPKDQKDRYEAVLKEVARYLSSLTGESFAWTAVEQQVMWAATTQEFMKSPGHARQFIMNKAAAIEMGFLTAIDLPDELLTTGGES